MQVEGGAQGQPAVAAAAAAAAKGAARQRAAELVVTAVCTTLVGLYALETDFAPASWGALSFCVWLLYAVRAWRHSMGVWDWRQFSVGMASTALFLHFALVQDPSFQGWADVYFFCGRDLRYCTCAFHWTLRGWGKGATLWAFVLTSALGLQKLLLQVGLGGLLPGEDIVTRESFISVCWRLIPYWLNNWEQQWGAECSSMLFELPHFAAELLVILPCVQILCARLKVLALPPAQRGDGGGGGGAAADEAAGEAAAAGLQEQGWIPQQAGAIEEGPPPAEGGPGGAAAAAAAASQQALVPCFFTGRWVRGPAQAQLLPRLKANAWVVGVALGVLGLAALNALVVPLALEARVGAAPRAGALLAAHRAGTFRNESAWAEVGSLDGGAGAAGLAPSIGALMGAYERAGCRDTRLLQGALRKHGRDLERMRSASHAELVPLVEVALAVMRLSCEHYFMLISVLAAYLLYQSAVPRTMRRIIRLNSLVSRGFQKVILYCFPAVCWAYGAGAVFSSFVSLVFWGHPAQRLWELLRHHATVVQPLGLRDATAEQVERMNRQCAVCWAELNAPLVRAGMRLLGAGPAPLGLGGGRPGRQGPLLSGKSLPCGHAFHEPCIRRWLEQCHGQGRRPTCPMCNALIELEVRYRLPLPWRSADPDELRLFMDAEEAPAPAQQAQQAPQAQAVLPGPAVPSAAPAEPGSPGRGAAGTPHRAPRGQAEPPEPAAPAEPRSPPSAATPPAQAALGEQAGLSCSWPGAGGSASSAEGASFVSAASLSPRASGSAGSGGASPHCGEPPDLAGAHEALARCQRLEDEAKRAVAAAELRAPDSPTTSEEGRRARLSAATQALALAQYETRFAQAHLQHEQLRSEVLRLRTQHASLGSDE